MHMRKKTKALFAIIGIVVLAAVGALSWYLHRHTVAVFEPAGQVGYRERKLMFFALILSAIVVLPTFAITIFIIWKYREGNRRPKKYSPDFDHSRLFESLWWGIPIVIITVLSVAAWDSSHSLDPYKPLASTKKPLTVEVVSLDWKWLFIYPEQHMASVNLLEVPVDTPVDFHLTSDSVMNSFWIPQLGGQIYTMPGMSTQLHLEADKTGSFYGSPANIAGEGFARMTFTAKSVSQQSFDMWTQSAMQSNRPLTLAAYTQLSRPSEGVPVTYYSSVPNNLYTYIVMKYMMPGVTMQSLGDGATDGSFMQAPSKAQSSMPPKSNQANPMPEMRM